VRSQIGRKRSAASRRSSIAIWKKRSSPERPSSRYFAIDSSYASLDLKALPKIVGFDVSPVTARSLMYRATVLDVRSSRVMLSSQMLWPASCSC